MLYVCYCEILMCTICFSSTHNQIPNSVNVSNTSLTDVRQRSTTSLNVTSPLKQRTNGTYFRTKSETSLTSYGDNTSLKSVNSILSLDSGSIASSHDGGYNYSQHFDISSPYTSSLALKYGPAEQMPSRVRPPTVWSMDVAHRLIALGCNDGSIEVSVMPSLTAAGIHGPTRCGIVPMVIWYLRIH